MIADAQNQVLHILQEEIIVIRFGAVPWIGQPEILPHHNSMTVAGFIERFIADLPDPVTNHGEVHFAVVAYGDVVFARAVAKHRFAESPVAAARDESASVDPYPQIAAIFAVGHVADACLEGPLVDGLSTGFEGNLRIVEVRFAITDGPPEFGILQVECGICRWIESDGFSFLGSELNALLNSNVAQLEVNGAAERMVPVVDEIRLQRQVGG